MATHNFAKAWPIQDGERGQFVLFDKFIIACQTGDMSGFSCVGAGRPPLHSLGGLSMTATVNGNTVEAYSPDGKSMTLYCDGLIWKQNDAPQA
jgi:hypothetical protein